MFTQKLEQLFGVRSSQRKVLGKNLKVYQGVRIRDYEVAEGLVGRLETPRELHRRPAVSQGEARLISVSESRGKGLYRGYLSGAAGGI